MYNFPSWEGNDINNLFRAKALIVGLGMLYVDYVFFVSLSSFTSSLQS